MLQIYLAIVVVFLLENTCSAAGCSPASGVTLALDVSAVKVFIIVLVEWLQRRPILPMYWRTIFNALKKYPQDTGLVYSPTVLEWFVGKLLTA